MWLAAGLPVLLLYFGPGCPGVGSHAQRQVAVFDYQEETGVTRRFERREEKGKR
jgi:hypothetical protein